MTDGFARSIRAGLLVSTMLAAVAADEALAQNAPPVRQSFDKNGVDLFRGHLRITAPGVSIGDGKKSLEYNWEFYGNGLKTNHNVLIERMGNIYIVSFGSRSTRFVYSGGLFTNTESDGTRLSFDNNNTYTFTGHSGETVKFSRSKALFPTEAVATEIDYGGGHKIIYDWTEVQYCTSFFPSEPDTCQIYATAARVAGFRNESNYSIRFNYATDSVPRFSTGLGSWLDLTGADAVNLSTNTVVQSTSLSKSSDSSYSYITVRDPLQRETRFKIGSLGLVSVKREEENSDSYIYGYSGGRVTSIQSPYGVTTYSSADNGNIKTVIVTEPGAQPVSYEFDINLARMTKMTDHIGRQVIWQYDVYGRDTRVTQHEGNYTQMTYDARGNVVETRRVAKASSGIPDLVTTATFDGCVTQNQFWCNKPKTTTDGRGAVTEYQYAPHGGVEKITYPAGADGARPETRVTYANLTSPVTGETVFKVSAVSACMQATVSSASSCVGNASESKESTVYDPINLRPVLQTIGAGNNIISSVALGYDNAGNLTSIDGPLPGASDTTRTFYDAARQVIKTVAPVSNSSRSRAITYAYDARGRIIQTTAGSSNPDGTAFIGSESVSRYYDNSDRLVRENFTAAGITQSVKQYSYGTRGFLRCAVVRMNPSVWLGQSDACSPNLDGRDGPDRVTQYTYDAVGRVQIVREGLGVVGSVAATQTNTYTPNGQLHTVKDANNNLTTYEYDGHDRLLKTTYPSATKGAAVSNASDYEQYTRDANGNIISHRLRDGNVLLRTYDALNRRTFDQNLGTNVSEANATYTYDLLGQLKRAEDVNGWYSAYEYDALGRVTKQSSNLAPNGIKFQYDAAGGRTRQEWHDGFAVIYDYDNTGAMTQIREENGGFVLASFGYDDLGRRTSLTRGNGTVTNYNYDTASRLATLTQNLAGTAHDVTYAYTYTPAGQIGTRTISNDAYAWTDYVASRRVHQSNGLNQLTSAGTTALGYDARGNLTSSGADSYTYNSRNQMSSGPGMQLLYRNPVGLLNHMIRAGDNVNTNFDYAGTELATEFGSPGRRYVYGPGVDEPLVWYEHMSTNDRRWFHADERGSIVAVSNASGQALAINTYDEFGIPGANNLGRFGFTGQKWIPEVGLYDYKARMYSPTLGRFMQTDPIGYADGMNMYNYVGGDPVNNRDPMGMCTKIVVHGIEVEDPDDPDCPSHNIYVEGPRASGTWEWWQGTSSNTGGYAGAVSGSPQIVKVAQPYTGDSFCGGPTVGRANRFNPFGRINSGKAGGYGTALNDVDRIAAANGIKPLGDVMVNSFTTGASILAAIPHGMGDGWYVSTNPISGYTSFSNSGLTIRYNAESGLIRIDIPSGFNLPSGGALAQPETCHYR